MVSNDALSKILRSQYNLNVTPAEVPALLKVIGEQVIASHFNRDAGNYWMIGVMQAHGGDEELLHNNITKNLMHYEIPG